MNNQFQALIDQFKQQRVLVVGETFLDAYYCGYVERICREAPVPIVEITQKQYAPGGAANVALNVAKLSAQTTFLSVIGSDTDGEIVKDQLTKHGVDTSSLLPDAQRRTMTKKRILADQQLLLRFDSGEAAPIKGEIEEALLNHLITLWEHMDAIIISDYGYGIITDNCLHVIKKLQQAMPRVLVIDSKYLDRFHAIPATAVKPNYKEAVALLGLTKTERAEARIPQISQHKYELLKKTNAAIVAVTLDAEGALIFDRNGSEYRTYAQRIENPKAAGAGDTYVAALTLCLAAGADSRTAAEIATGATKVIVKKQATAFCTLDELRATLSANDKIITDRKTLEVLIQTYRNQGKKIVFSNGCFDILHSGHVSYLNQAKSFGDLLILGVNTDESIKAIKGSDRPINPLRDRMQVLTALSSVNYVVPMPERTASALVQLIRPDIYVKGGDYTLHTLPEAKIVLGYGGKSNSSQLSKANQRPTSLNA